MKSDAKFYAIHISPSEKEIKQMSKTEEEQTKTMKRYVREVFIPEYAKNFNKELIASDIRFYGKIHFHLIVSRKDQADKIKISPMTNHRNTKTGAIKGGFNRTHLIEQSEKVFDKLFGYNRSLGETFQYCNTMKNGTIDEKLQMQKLVKGLRYTTKTIFLAKNKQKSLRFYTAKKFHRLIFNTLILKRNK